jgi:release factor glutamine methyltransferase
VTRAASLAIPSPLDAAVGRLVAAGIDTARVDAEWLLAGILGVNRGAAAATLARSLTPAAVARFQAAVDRRSRREPLQRILGWEDFRGVRVALGPDVLVPRPETELLVEYALALLPPAAGRRPLVVDVGTGSGCIACALAVERPDVDVVAIDVSPEAVRIARRNITAAGVRDRVRVLVGDLLAPIGGAVDLVVANLPYLPSALIATLAPEVAHHEPRLALDGGPDGLSLVRRLLAGAWAPRVGAIALETAGAGQSAIVAELARVAGFESATVCRDLAGVDRFVTARAGVGGGRAAGTEAD